jgi:hypothetical protein
VFSYFGIFFNSENTVLKFRTLQNIFCKVTGRRLGTEAEKEENT